MPNFKQAPKLYHDKQQNYQDVNYYSLPQRLMDSVFQQLDGKCGNQIKLMCVLLGTLGNGSFGVSEAWIAERTGMVQQTYNTARKALIERGWIVVENGKIFVLPQIILNGFHYLEGATDQDKIKIRQATISHCVNKIKKLYSIDKKLQTQYDVVSTSNSNHITTLLQTQCEVVPQTQFEVVPQTQCDVVYNKINNKINDKNKIEFLSQNQDKNSMSQVQISGQVTHSTIADMLGEKEIINDNLLYLPNNGKFFKIIS